MWQFFGKLVNRLPLCFPHPNQIFLSNGKHHWIRKNQKLLAVFILEDALSVQTDNSLKQPYHCIFLKVDLFPSARKMGPITFHLVVTWSPSKVTPFHVCWRGKTANFAVAYQFFWPYFSLFVPQRWIGFNRRLMSNILGPCLPQEAKMAVEDDGSGFCYFLCVL